VLVECLVEDFEIGLGCGAVIGIHNRYRLTDCVETVVRRFREVGVVVNSFRSSVRAHLDLWCSGWVGGAVD